MDREKLAVFLKELKKHHFWVLSALVILIALGVTYVTGSRLLQEFNQNQQKVTSNYTQMESLRREPKLPNEGTIKGMNRRIDLRRKEVAEAWNQKYEDQAKILVWPAELRNDFIQAVAPLRPIEEKVSTVVDLKTDLHPGLRERYRDYIKEELPKLADVIAAKWETRSEGSTSPMGPQPRVVPGAKKTEPAEDDGQVVRWNAANQNELQTRHFDWSNKSDKVPSTLEVLYAQEDLWVLKALMNVIKNTNDEANAHHSAAVREITSIHIGHDAVGRQGKVTQIGPAPTGETTTSSTPGAENDPAEGRYVDKNYEPLSAERLRSAAKSESPEDAYLAVAKRMPVRMQLRVDQRKLNRLLIECGNSDLTVEIRQVRVNRNSASSRSAIGNTYGSTSRESGGTRDSKDNPYPYDVDVELYGIVYIYNPVSNERLGIENAPPPDGPILPPAAPPAALTTGG